ncbi:hypothetical protein [Arthrobacter pityocampae]|uniref:hypothetical protein n=1 Tax=Arthrobacter pityocampae TaxID=547334 RepID=UPI0019D4C5E3|nr:hypothetical protein [Arthrobacter pityocampae]
MALDTSGLENWASPGDLEAAAKDISSVGADVSATVDGLSATWSGLSGSYHAPEQVDVLAVFSSITPHGDVLERATAQTTTALDDFAATVRLLEMRRTALLAEVASFEADPRRLNEADPDPSLGPVPEYALQSDIDRLVLTYDDAVTDCVAALKGIDGTEGDILSTLSGPEVGLVAAGLSNYASTYTYKSVEVTATRQVRMPWQQFRFTPSDPSGVLTDAEVAGDRWYTMGDGSVVHISDPAHPDHASTVRERYTRNGFVPAVEWRPSINKKFYDSLPAYRARVDANPDSWQPSSEPATPRPAFGELPNGLKAARVGGGVLAVGMAGFTITDERNKAYDSLLVEHPEMSEAQRDLRAMEVGAVRGGAKTAFDFGAGAAGAAVGTMIGGPVGTVIGFGVGMGVSYLADQDLPEWLGGGTVKDRFADGVEEAYDLGKDITSDIGDALSDGWNSVFG